MYSVGEELEKYTKLYGQFLINWTVMDSSNQSSLALNIKRPRIFAQSSKCKVGSDLEKL